MFIVSILIEEGRKWNDLKFPKHVISYQNTDHNSYDKENSDFFFKKYFVEDRKYKIFIPGKKATIVQLFSLVCSCSVSKCSYKAFLRPGLLLGIVLNFP